MRGYVMNGEDVQQKRGGGALDYNLGVGRRRH